MSDMNHDDFDFNFARALRQGRGSAAIHIASHGLDAVRSLVLQACLEEQAYDAQCEGQRAGWLYPMFKGTSHYPFFQREIIATLQRPSEENSIEQLCELLALMARDGDQVAGVALREFFWSQDDRGEASMRGSHAIASLDGLPAVLEIARRCGRILQKDPDSWIDYLDGLIDGKDEIAATMLALSSHERDDIAVAAFMDRERQAIAERRICQDMTAEQRLVRDEKANAGHLEKFPLADVLAAAAAHDRSRGKFFRFGRLCSDQDRLAVAERLCSESDSATCLRLLWVFHRVALPFIPAPLWSFIEHADGEIRWAALTALARVVDPAIGDFARDYLRRLQFSIDDAPVIELFVNNFQAGDEIRLMDFLATLRLAEHPAHAIGMSILHFCEHHNDAATAPLLEWLYHSNPCTICRRKAIELMIEAGTLGEPIARESAFDASEQTCDMIRRIG